MHFYFPFCFWDIHWWQTAPLPLRNLNIFFKCWSKYKCRDMFGICTCWGFPKHPQDIKVHEVFTEIFLIKDKWYDSRTSSKLIKIDEKLMKSAHFVSKVIDSTSLIDFSKRIIIDIDVPVSRIIFRTKSSVFMRFSCVFIN